MSEMGKAVFVAEIDQAELAIRLARVAIGLKPPPEMGAREALAKLEASWPPESGPFPFWTMALKAIEFFQECIAAGQKPS